MSKIEKKDHLLSDDVKTIIPVVPNMAGQLINVFLSVLTTGIWYLLFVWNKKVWRSVRFTEVPIEQAEYLILITERGREIVVDIGDEVHLDGKMRPYAFYKHVKFVYEDDGKWRAKKLNFSGQSNTQVKDQLNGLTKEVAEALLPIYGTNSTKIKVDNLFVVIVRDCTSPVTMYQVCCLVIWWGFRGYAAFSIFILVLLLLDILLQAYYIISFQKRINTMKDSVKVTVLRGTEGPGLCKSVIPSEELVPGDLIEIPAKCKLPCDLLLVSGTAIVDENLLTGETVPQYKSPLPTNNEQFVTNCLKSEHTLMAGTTALISSSPDKHGHATGFVLHTGFSTLKGGLIRGIIYEKVRKFKFDRDGRVWFYCLLGLSVVFMAIFLITAFSKFSEEVDEK